MSGALQMPSQPQAVASYKCSNEAVSTRKKYSSASLENSQNVKKTYLLICDGIACNRLGSLTSLGLISAHVRVRSIALHEVRHCFRKHQLCLHICAHFSLLAGVQPSLNIFFFSCLHLWEVHQLVLSCGFILVSPNFTRPLRTLVCLLTPLCICCSPPSLPAQLLWFSWAWLHDFLCWNIFHANQSNTQVHSSCPSQIIFLGLFIANWRTYHFSSY